MPLRPAERGRGDGRRRKGLPAEREATPGCRVHFGWNSLQFLSWLWHRHLLFLGRHGFQGREARWPMSSLRTRMGAGSQVHGRRAGPHVRKVTRSGPARTSECDRDWRYGPERGGPGRTRSHGTRSRGPVRLASLREGVIGAQTRTGGTTRGRGGKAAAYAPRGEAPENQPRPTPGGGHVGSRQARPSGCGRSITSLSFVGDTGRLVNANLGGACRPKRDTPLVLLRQGGAGAVASQGLLAPSGCGVAPRGEGELTF